MSEKINTGHYIRGHYIPNIRKLADVLIKIMEISAPVSIMPLGIKTFDAIGYAERKDGEEEYTIYIDTGILREDALSDQVINLMIHEMWHVKQMESGRLRSNIEYTVAVWEGVYYATQTVPHEMRPWEIEAKNKEVEYFNKVKDQIQWK